VNVQFWEQATNHHSNLIRKSGPLLGTLLYFKFGISVCNQIKIQKVRRPLLGTKISLKLPINQSNTVV
jgi:hypothetical protein